MKMAKDLFFFFFFFFFFFAFHFLKQLKFVLGLSKGNFLPEKTKTKTKTKTFHDSGRKKIRKSDFAPSEKYSSYATAVTISLPSIKAYFVLHVYLIYIQANILKSDLYHLSSS